MAQVVKGVVVWAGDEKKYGNYSFKLKDNDSWFRSPKRCEDIIQPGYTVQVKVEENDRGDLELVAKPKLVKKGKPPAKGGKGGRRGGGGYKADPEREKRIVMQHSQEMGLAAAKLIIEQEAIKLGGKNKPDERKKQIVILVDELTAKFFNESFDPSKVLAGQAEVDEDFEDEEETDEEESEDFDDDVDWDED